MTGRERVREAIEAALGRPVGELVVLGRGTDHVAVEVEGDLVARLPLATGAEVDSGIDDGADDDRAGRIAHEVRVLRLVAALSPVPVPEVVAADPARDVLVTRKIPGSSLLGRSLAVGAGVVDRVAALVAALHGPDVGELTGPDGLDVDDYPLVRYLDDAADSWPDVEPWLTPDRRRAVERFLASAPPPEPDPGGFVLSHNDLGAEHLLVDAGGTRLTGVIDWSDAAVADPARDLGKLHRDLGPAATATILRALPAGLADDADLARRIAFQARCSLLEDLAHATTGDAPAYARAALASFPHTFPTDRTPGRCTPTDESRFS